MKKLIFVHEINGILNEKTFFCGMLHWWSSKIVKFVNLVHVYVILSNINFSSYLSSNEIKATKKNHHWPLFDISFYLRYNLIKSGQFILLFCGGGGGHSFPHLARIPDVTIIRDKIIWTQFIECRGHFRHFFGRRQKKFFW